MTQPVDVDTAAQTPSPPTSVSEPDLPPLRDLLPDLARLWESRRLTNFGEFIATWSRASAPCSVLRADHLVLV